MALCGGCVDVWMCDSVAAWPCGWVGRCVCVYVCEWVGGCGKLLVMACFLYRACRLPSFGMGSFLQFGKII